MIDSRGNISSITLVTLVGAGIVLRLIFAVTTPISGRSVPHSLSAYNDELAHAKYAQHIALTRSLPTQTESIQQDGAVERGEYESYQPPLFYLVVALAYGLFNTTAVEGAIWIGRTLNIIAGLALIWLWLMICHEIGVSKLQELAGVAFISLGGVFVRFGSTCTNDILFWIVVGAIILIHLRLTRKPQDVGLWTSLALTTALGFYVKLSTIILVPLVLFPVIRTKELSTTFFAAGSTSLAILLTFPIWIRNLCDFGSLVPLQAGFGAPVWRWPTWETFTYGIRSLVFPWSEFWMNGFGLLFLSPSIVLLMLGSYRFLVDQAHNKLVLVFSLVLSIVAFLLLNLQYHQAEGRYLFSAWPVLSLCFAIIVSRPRSLWIISAALLLPYLLIIVGVST